MQQLIGSGEWLRLFPGKLLLMAAFAKRLALGCGIALVFFILVELILLAAGVVSLYERTDPYVGFSGYAPLFLKHTTSGGESIYETADNKIQWFNLQRFPARKAKGVIRIFCIGGSTTYGRPYDDRTSFCGWLRLFLPAVDPNRRWEVINAGGISYASYRVARLMEELANYEPDLFIVYSGHNEFLEKRTYDKLLKTPELVRNLAALASRMRLYSLLYEVTNKRDEVLSTEVKALLDRSVGPEDYHRDDEKRVAVLDHYRNSLTRMTHIIERAGAKLILVTPASNIGNFSPFKTEPSTRKSDLDIRQVNTLKLTLNAALDNGDHVRANAIAEQALALDDRDAELLYLQARALRALGRIDEARKAFTNARDEDICPLRALTPIHEIVTDVARTKNTGLVDFVRIVNENSADNIPGSELFLDHVHPTIQGNRLLALAIVQEMVHEGIVSPGATWNNATIAEISEKLESSLDEQAHAVALKNLSKVLGWAGKHDEAERLVNLAVATSPEDGETHFQKGILLKKAGDKEAALVHYREAARLAPWNAFIHQGLGVLLSELDRTAEARVELETAIRLDPKLTNVHYDLGIVLQALGKGRQAEAAYRTALDLDPSHVDTHNNLGVLLAQRGNLAAASEHFAEALRLDPDNKDAAANLAIARQARNR
ncbi:tetratricopeptide repeat protein [candidate division KSB1 bacterium]|nr:tetratricopeptide repeat protein [candidate division KSB1 bacterium]